jgi:hypothetical protein
MTDQTLPPQDETKSIPDEWLSLLTGQMAYEDAGALLLRTAADMQQFLDARPQAEQHIPEIIARRLPARPTAQTWQPIYGSINNYIGQQDLTDMIAWVAQSDQVNRLNEVEKYASPRVMAFLRTIVGLYGTDLQEALTVMSQVPNDWRRLNRDVYFDMANRRYRIKLRVELFSGDEFSIDAEPTMMLRLTSYLVRTLRYVPEPSAFTQADVDEFIEEARELINLWFPEPEHAPATDETTTEDEGLDEESV